LAFRTSSDSGHRGAPMITEIYVNGYRSLSAFQIPVSPGLNIVVGPNGGGKTNILSFFEFLSKLVTSPVDEAVSSHGGVGRVFSRLPDNRFQRTLDGRVRGVVKFRNRSGRMSRLWYTWDFEVSSSEAYDEIYYTNQRLFIDLRKEPKDPWRSDLIVALGSSERFAHLTIERMITTRLQSFFQTFQVFSGGYVNRVWASRYLLSYSRSIDLSKIAILNAFPAQMDIFRSISRDIRGGETYNFVPDICKQPDDSARPAVIEKNGAGLASTLYRLERTPRREDLYRRALYTPSTSTSSTIEKIRHYVSLVSDSIKNIYTERNPIDNKISVFLTIGERDEDVSFPLAHCSDGTVKWIALITTLLTSRGGFAIEEPENFLHPNIQKEFVNIVRDETKDDVSSFTMVSTHSESLLNEASPDELILVWMEEGVTVARRVENAEDLVAEINRTGFGLGYYYTSGGVS
jgi:predicted ATPase